MNSRRPLWRVSVTTSAEAEEAVGVLLEETMGCVPSVYENADSGVSVVSVFLSQPPAADWRGHVRAGLERIAACGLDCGPARLELGRVKKEDWSESWKKHFQPVEIGPGLLVKPSWSRRPARRGQAVVILDPGLSFGTGQHPTTRFCLRQLEGFRRDGDAQSMLDLGTGSGILAIAAAKLGYRPVVALEVDAAAAQIARGNCARNRVAAAVSVQLRDLSGTSPRRLGRFDLVCANLSDELLVAEWERITACLKRDGRLVLAGILARRFSDVVRRYEAGGFRLVRTRLEKEWQSGVFARIG